MKTRESTLASYLKLGGDRALSSKLEGLKIVKILFVLLNPSTSFETSVCLNIFLL